MAVGYITSLRNTRMDAIKTAIDAGGAAGKLRIYSGTRPATGGTETTLLAELPLAFPSCGASSGGVLTFNGITAANAVATGTATWARVLTSANAAVVDLSVGTSGADLNLNSTSINTGVQVSVTSLTLTDGNP
jgi:hypothetical protein